ncbi:MAG: DDE-type integrase/transposase/recombinase [Thaumarchaeota archaeon]|nr:DDE-type integrase/transposase/recombinase [Candidatus Geocrenenecus arthurdayi]
MGEKAYSIMLHIAGLSLRDVSERYCVTMASRENVRRWFHRFSKIFSVDKKFRDTVAVDETVVKMHGLRAYVWSAVDVDSGEVLVVYASRSRNMLIALKFLMIVLDRCISKPLIIVDRSPWYRWALERLGLRYRYLRFGLRNRVERFFGYLKQRTKRFYNNINTWRIESIEDYAAAIAIIRNILTIMKTRGGVLPG